MNSLQISLPQTNPWQELMGYCAIEVLHAPKTWGDPLSSAQIDPSQNVQAVINYVLRILSGRPWNNHLMLLAAVLYSQNIQYRTIQNYLTILNSGFVDLFATLGLQSMAQWDVDSHLTLYLTRQVLDTHTATQRETFWKRYQTGSRHLKRWLTGLPPEHQTVYRPYVLPYPDDPHELTRLSGKRQIEYDRQERRKADTDSIMPFFTDLRTQAHLRYNLILRLRKAYHKAIKMVEQGKAVLPFEFEMREGGSEKHNRPPSERLIFKLWDRRTFVLEQCKENPEIYPYHTRSDAENRRKGFVPERNFSLLELVRTEALDGTSPTVGLWFMELLKHEVLGTLNQNSPQILEAKQAWLREQGYQGYEVDKERVLQPFRTTVPGVLTSTSASGDPSFMQNAKQRTGVIFIPVEPLYVAAAFGMVALHIFTANGMRVGEILQLRASSECIVPMVIPPSPEAEDQRSQVHWAVRAVPKGHRSPATYYLDDEHLRLLSLIKFMLCESYGVDLKSGGDLPIVAMGAKNAHRFPPDRYLFQYDQQGLREEDLRACMRFLVHGLVFQTVEGHRVTVLPHLLRHGFATWALNVAKEPIDIVAAILNQKHIAITKYYGRPNQRFIAERSHGLMNQISSYIDMDDAILRSPEELRDLLKKAQKTHGPLARTRGGRCMLSGECPILFACIGCSAKVPDPTQRGEVEKLAIKADRDQARVRQRYMKLNREELVDQLILIEQEYAQIHERWLTTNDKVLEWQLRAEQAEALLQTQQRGKS